MTITTVFLILSSLATIGLCSPSFGNDHVQAVLLNPGGIGGIFKGPDSQTIVQGPDGSVITSEAHGAEIHTQSQHSFAVEPIVVQEDVVAVEPIGVAHAEVNSNHVQPVTVNLEHAVAIKTKPIETAIVDAPEVEPNQSSDLIGPSGRISTKGSHAIIEGPASVTVTGHAVKAVPIPVVPATPVHVVLKPQVSEYAAVGTADLDNHLGAVSPHLQHHVSVEAVEISPKLAVSSTVLPPTLYRSPSSTITSSIAADHPNEVHGYIAVPVSSTIAPAHHLQAANEASSLRQILPPVSPTVPYKTVYRPVIEKNQLNWRYAKSYQIPYVVANSYDALPHTYAKSYQHPSYSYNKQWSLSLAGQKNGPAGTCCRSAEWNPVNSEYRSYANNNPKSFATIRTEYRPTYGTYSVKPYPVSRENTYTVTSRPYNVGRNIEEWRHIDNEAPWSGYNLEVEYFPKY